EMRPGPYSSVRAALGALKLNSPTVSVPGLERGLGRGSRRRCHRNGGGCGAGRRPETIREQFKAGRPERSGDRGTAYIAVGVADWVIKDPGAGAGSPERQTERLVGATLPRYRG